MVLVQLYFNEVAVLSGLIGCGCGGVGVGVGCRSRSGDVAVGVRQSGVAVGVW